MHTVPPRRGRWSLALTMAALAACADDAVGPKQMPTLKATVAPPGEFTVTNTSGGTIVGSLRWAATQAATQMPYGGGYVVFDPSLAGQTITLQGPVDVLGPVGLVGPLDIRGPKDKGITISGNYVTPLLRGRGVSVENVTLTKGNGGPGSAIYSESGVYVNNSTIHDNRGGSAILTGQGTFSSILNSTISANTGFGNASAIEYRYTSGVSIMNSTLVANGPAPAIGPYLFDSPIPDAPGVQLRNSILFNNGSPLQNCKIASHIQPQSMNIVNDGSCGTGPAIFVGDPLLFPLADNGGPTQTYALGHRSPAINSGGCTGGFPAADQRYVARDQFCDIGAFEFTDWTIVKITVDASVTVQTATGVATVIGTVQCSRDDTFGVGVQLNQTQKVNKTTTTVVRGSGAASVNCTTLAQPWSATVTPWSGGEFQNGAASATAFTNDVPIWVKQVFVDKSVKITRRR